MSSFVGIGGRQIHYRLDRPQGDVRGALLLVHGYTEYSARYDHVIAAMNERGYVVLAQDHRGHGRTGGVPGDIESFELILGDLAIAHRLLVEAAGDVPVFLFGHSMGGMLGVRYVARYNDAFAGAIFSGSAIMLPTNTPRWLLLVARLLGRVTPRLPVHGDYDPSRSRRDPDAIEAMRTDPLVYRGKVRARTASEGLKNIRKARKELGSITVPVLVTHGGEDRTVPLQASRDLFAGVCSTDRTLHVFEGMLHEAHNEPEPASSEVISFWLDWMDARV